MLLLLLVVLTNCCISSLGNTVTEKKCNEDVFPKPYVILKKSKNGPEVAKLETQGVIDLREAVHSYICINGAVILYKGASIHKGQLGKASSPNSTQGLSHIAHLNPGETIRFSNGSFQLFSHKCMHINKIPNHEMDQMKARGQKPIILTDSTVLGVKLIGVFLLTTKEPFDPSDPPLKIMLNRKAFGYKIGADEHIIKDASFVAVGKGPYCLSHKDGSKIVLSSSAKEDKEICRWSRSNGHDADIDYKKLLKRGYSSNDFNWEDCPTDIMNSKSNNASSGNDGNVSAGAAPPDDQSKPFAILNPNSGSTRTSNNGKYGKDSTSSGNALKDPTISSEEAADPALASNSTTVNYFIELTDCATYPTFNATDPLCQFVSPDNFNCEKLSIGLELDLNSTSSPPSTVKRSAPQDATTPLTLTGNPLLQWKQEVLSIVANIFSKICVPIRKQSVFQLMNVIGNYIATAHTADPENYEPYKSLVQKSTLWDVLISSLDRCLESNKTVPLQWEWSENIKGSGGKNKSPAPPTPGKRKKRSASGKPALKTLLSDQTIPYNLGNEDDLSKLIIQRSSSIFTFDDNDESTNDIIFGKLPRWRRQAGLEKLALPAIQEYTPPAQTVSHSSERKLTYDDFMFHPEPSHLRIKGNANKQIFYYEDHAQHVMDLNKAIDAFWKILSSVMGFCQMNEISRGNAIYPLLLHNFDEYFLSLIKDQWKNPAIEEEVEMILGEFMDDDRARWLDTCVETSYIVSESLKFRPPRPLEIDAMGSESVNGSSKTKVNTFVQMPENISGASANYFTRKKIAI